MHYYRINSTSAESPEVRGSGNRELMVICHQADATRETLNKLNEILEAIRYHPGEDTFLAIFQDGQDPDLHALQRDFPFKDVLFFTDHPANIDLNIETEYYHIYTFETFQLLVSEPISDIMVDKKKKLKLWKALQSSFIRH